jgi:hypothetical protein
MMDCLHIATNMGLSSGSSNIGSTAKPNPTTTNQHHLGALGGKDNSKLLFEIAPNLFDFKLRIWYL